MSVRIVPSADVDERAELGDGTTVWHLAQVREGASIGARSVCVAPVTIGRWALVAAGSVVVKDVPDFALVAGVPARRLHWVGRAGVPLEPDPDRGEGAWRCPQTGQRFTETTTRTDDPNSSGQLIETLTEAPA